MMIGMNMAMQACHTSRGAAARPAAGLSGSRLGGPRPLARRLALCRLGRNNKPVASQDQQQQQQQDQRPRTAPPPAVDRVPAAAPRCTGNADKEESRKFRRVTFDHAAWANHRSTSRYWRHVASMPRSRVVKGLAVPMGYVGTVATLVCCYEAMLERHLLPDWGFDWPGLAVSTTGVYSLSTFALSLLLVFRTNSSYHRWNDARKLWGLTTNRCRDLARQVLQWMTDPSDAQLAAAACRLIRAFPIALMASLRTDHDLKRDLAAVLQPQELDLILQQPHTGTAILQALGSVVAASRIKEVQKLRIDENITVMQDTMGGCERIFRTPIPLVYTRHTSRFLLVWLTILPFCTAGQVGWLSVPIACAMAFFLLGIEEIGVQVEEPFGILALEQFCENISKNVLQAESAAAAMQAVAHGHAFQQAALQAALGAMAGGADAASVSSASTSSVEAMGAVAARQPGTSSSSSSSSKSTGATAAALPWRPLRPAVGLVAGQQVAAAEQAYSTGAAVALPAAAAAAAADGSIGSMGSSSFGSREYEVAPDSSEDAGAYWPSGAVAEGAARASEDPF